MLAWRIGAEVLASKLVRWAAINEENGCVAASSPGFRSSHRRLRCTETLDRTGKP
jgi:hypothetical protein